MWAPFGEHGWRPGAIIGLGKRRGDNTVIHLRFEKGGKGRRVAGKLWSRKPELKGKHKLNALTSGHKEHFHEKDEQAC